MKYLYRLYLIVFALPILAVATIITSLTTSIGSRWGNAAFWGDRPGRLWSRTICRVLLIRVRVIGYEQLDKNVSYVFVSNHQGSFDVFLICGYLGHSFKWMMKKSLRKVPFVGKACADAGHIFVDRGNPKGVMESIQQAKKTLIGGTSMVVFAEGARSQSAKMGRFKRGAFQLAYELQLPIVPLTINDSFRILPRNSRWIHPYPLTLTIHAPIPPQATEETVIEALETTATSSLTETPATITKTETATMSETATANRSNADTNAAKMTQTMDTVHKIIQSALRP